MRLASSRSSQEAGTEQVKARERPGPDPTGLEATVLCETMEEIALRGEVIRCDLIMVAVIKKKKNNNTCFFF